MNIHRFQKVVDDVSEVADDLPKIDLLVDSRMTTFGPVSAAARMLGENVYLPFCPTGRTRGPKFSR